MNLRYPCLILDHDDTAVDSTAEIHYPAHREIMKYLRPGTEPISLEGWFSKNFHPGIMHYLTDELQFTDEELEAEYRIWRKFTTSRIPTFYPGFLETLQEYKKRGGIITVVSHSEEDIIRRHYGEQDNGLGYIPEMIFGWTYDEEKRKPHPFPVREILKHFNKGPEDALIVDDLKPGVLMGTNTGVTVAAAGWSHNIPEIQDYMKENCAAYFTTVSDFRDFILS